MTDIPKIDKLFSEKFGNTMETGNIVFSPLQHGYDQQKINYSNPYIPGVDNSVIKIRKIDPDLLDMKQTDKSRWIDLYASKIAVCDSSTLSFFVHHGREKCYDADKVCFLPGQSVILFFGFAAKLPKGYEAQIRPRSSTYVNYGLILGNGVGTIDPPYCGDNDEWKAVFFCTRGGEINRYARLCQFRIDKEPEQVEFEIVESMDSPDRGGYGSTGE